MEYQIKQIRDHWYISWTIMVKPQYKILRGFLQSDGQWGLKVCLFETKNEAFQRLEYFEKSIPLN